MINDSDSQGRKTGIIAPKQGSTTLIVTTTIIRNRLGLHARAASRLVQTAQEYAAEIQLRHGNHTANGKSIMAIMMLQAGIGAELILEVEGDDEAQAAEAITALIENRFGEEE